MFIIDVDYKDGIKGKYNNKPFDNSRYKYALTLICTLNNFLITFY